MNVYAKYQWQNYGAANENEWDGYRFKIKYFVPITDLWGGQLSYIGFTNFDWGSDLGDDSGNAINGIKTRTNNSIRFQPYSGSELRSLALLCRSSLLARRWSVERRCRTELRQRQLQRSLYRLGWFTW
ncbi:nucleoside-specific channel-forming protein tsx [Escherichia coli]|uniref:Nucleoside-specific channel-forming protein tsx n=1 Tax=Escherichia coli TaxID=562 RepID=A0A2X1IMD4_ECOLX|nr:nucleoside-specific channel-forming protein tsx [Escherichia coli]